MEGNTARGASSPAKPAFTNPEPLSHTKAVVSSSSHMMGSGEELLREQRKRIHLSNSRGFDTVK